MKRYRLFLMMGLIAVLFPFAAFQGGSNPEASPNTNNHPGNGYRIVGYVTGWRGLDFSTIQAEKLTHINYAFANCIDGEIRFGSEENRTYNDSINVQDLADLGKLKGKNPNLKILISVGGWSMSKNFSDVALTEESRAKFASSAVAFIKKHQIDGVDIDWEYPGQIGAGNVFRAADKQNFTLLLKKVREYLDVESEKEGKKGPDRYLLTIATGASQRYIDNTELAEAQKYLDFINIMTYDFHTGSSPLTGHHANLYLSEIPGTTSRSTDKAVRMHVDAGVPSEKLVLGVPFYGRIWYGVPSRNNGLYQVADSGSGSAPYSKIKTDFNQEEGFVKHKDEAAAAVFLFNKDDKTFVTYDDLNTLVQKMEYVKKNNLGGVMFWEYSHDHNSELLSTIYEELMK